MYGTSKAYKKSIPVVRLAAGIFIFFGITFYGGISVKAMPLPKNDYVLCVNAVGRTYEFSYPDIDFDGNGYYLKNIDAVTDGIFADTVVRPKDAEVRVSPELDEPFTYVKERSGTGINRRKLAEDISAALKCGGNVVNAETEELFPSVTLADLKAETRPLSVFETVYSFSGEARKSNIALACDYIGYRRIAPGCEFSFNTAVGRRSEERGFRPAAVILNGTFTDGIGGGVCQVSSTVYACAASAGMKITERRRHSLSVGYTEPSFDAMVSDDFSDLRFVNSSDRPVFLLADADGDRVRIRLYGKPDGKTYKFVSETIAVVEPNSPKIEESDELPTGEIAIKVRPKRGVKSNGWLYVYENGNLTEKKLLSRDSYSALDGVIVKGTGMPAKNKTNRGLTTYF